MFIGIQIFELKPLFLLSWLLGISTSTSSVFYLFTILTFNIREIPNLSIPLNYVSVSITYLHFSHLLGDEGRILFGEEAVVLGFLDSGCATR